MRSLLAALLLQMDMCVGGAPGRAAPSYTAYVTAVFNAVHVLF
jgi:hypothetical protein